MVNVTFRKYKSEASIKIILLCLLGIPKYIIFIPVSDNNHTNHGFCILIQCTCNNTFPTEDTTFVKLPAPCYLFIKTKHRLPGRFSIGTLSLPTNVCRWCHYFQEYCDCLENVYFENFLSHENA